MIYIYTYTTIKEIKAINLRESKGDACGGRGGREWGKTIKITYMDLKREASLVRTE